MTRQFCDKCGKERNCKLIQLHDHTEGEIMHACELCMDCQRALRHLVHDFVKSVVARN